MVAPHDTGDLVRSLVRVPGSGSDRTAGSECLDLARASSLAASVPVPSTLPPALATPKVTPPPAKKLDNQGVAAGILPKSSDSESRKRQLPESSSATEGNSAGTSPPPKRARIVYMTPQELQSHASRVVPLNTPNGTVLFLAAEPRTANSPPINLSKASLAELIKERDNLRKENQELQKRLALFQQLFRDKKRLTSVVKHLGVNVP